MKKQILALILSLMVMAGTWGIVPAYAENAAEDVVAQETETIQVAQESTEVIREFSETEQSAMPLSADHPIADGIYRLRDTDSNNYLTGANTFSSLWQESNTQIYIIKTQPDGCYTIAPYGISGSSMKYKADEIKAVMDWSYNEYGDDLQRWIIQAGETKDGQQCYTISPKTAPTYGMVRQSPTNFNILFDYHPTIFIQWAFELYTPPASISDGPHSLVGSNSTLCISTQYAAMEPKTPLYITDRWNTSWNFTRRSDGYYTITSVSKPNMYMTYDSSNNSVYVDTFSYSEGHLWLVYLFDNKVTLVPKSNLLMALSPDNGSAHEEQQVKARSIASSWTGSGGCWRIDAYLTDGGVYDIKNLSNDWYLTMGSSDYPKENSYITVDNTNGSADFADSYVRWRATYTNTGYYTLQPTYNPVNQLYMTYDSATDSVILKPETNDASQEWRIVKNGSLYLISPRLNVTSSLYTQTNASSNTPVSVAGNQYKYDWQFESSNENRALVDGTYDLFDQSSYFTLHGTEAGINSPAEPYSANGLNSHRARWTLTYEGDGTYSIAPSYNPKNLCFTYSPTSDWCSMQVKTEGNIYQKWQIVLQDNGKYVIRAKYDGGQLSERSTVYLVGSDSTEWTITRRENRRPLPDGTYQFLNNGKVICASVTSTSGGTPVPRASNQTKGFYAGWNIQYKSNDQYTISLVGKYASLYLAFDSSINQITLQYVSSGASAPTWRIADAGDGVRISPSNKLNEYLCHITSDSTSYMALSRSADTSTLWAATSYIYNETLVNGSYYLQATNGTYITIYDDGVDVSVIPDSQQPESKWSVTQQTDGTYFIKDGRDYLCGAAESSARVSDLYLSSRSFKWNLQPLGGDSYLISTSDGEYISITNGVYKLTSDISKATIWIPTL